MLSQFPPIRLTSSTRSIGLLGLCFAVCTFSSFGIREKSLNAQEALPDFRQTSIQLQQSTVTIRVEQQLSEDFGIDEEEAFVAEEAIEVFTGVCLGDRLVAAPMLVGPTAEVRVTLVDGEQCTARPVVVDEFTGLALLRIDRDEVGSLELASDPPDVGSWVLSAAAWGIERPVISYGIVGGIDRRLAGTHFPPLLLCDLRTTDTSSGSPVVNQQGELAGIVIAATNKSQRGWTYAIPTRHVERLLRTLEQHLAKLEANPDSGDAANEEGEPQVETDESVIVIQHRRPIVGMVLEDDGTSIVVAHVTPGGPAEDAGIEQGDRILGLEGTRIRSVYQAVLPTYHHQPGEILTYQVSQDGNEKDIAVVLGGDVALPASSVASLSELIDPKVRIAGFKEMLAQLSADDFDEVAGSSSDQGQPVRDSAMALLERAIANYQMVIAIQHQELQRLEEERQIDRARLESFEKELQQLRELVRNQSSDSADVSSSLLNDK